MVSDTASSVNILALRGSCWDILCHYVFYFHPIFAVLNYLANTCSVPYISLKCLCLSGVQKRAGGGDEGEDGNRHEDEAVPPLDEERGAGPADLYRRLTGTESILDDRHACLSANTHRGTPRCVRNVPVQKDYIAEIFS